MKDAREIGRIARDETQGAFAVERLKAIEKLSGDLKIKLHSQTHAHQFIYFSGRAERERGRSNSRHRQLGTLPYGQSAHGAPFKALISPDGIDNVRNIAACLDQNEFTRSPAIARNGASDADGVTRQIQHRHTRGAAD